MSELNTLNLDVDATRIVLAAFGFCVTVNPNDPPRVVVDAMQKVRYAHEGLEAGKGASAQIALTNDEVAAIGGILAILRFGSEMGKIDLTEDEQEALEDMVEAHLAFSQE